MPYIYSLSFNYGTIYLHALKHVKDETFLPFEYKVCNRRTVSIANCNISPKELNVCWVGYQSQS